MAIGPIFGDELIAAGLGGLPLVWSEDGAIAGRDLLTEAQNKSLDALLANHNPLAQRPQAESRDLQLARALLAQGDEIIRMKAALAALAREAGGA